MEKNTEAEAAKRIKEKSGGQFEYVSGYKNKESKVFVRCINCGEVVERTYHHITTHPSRCTNCRRIEKEQAEEEKAKERVAKKKRQEEIERQKELRRIERNIPHPCPVCGAMTTRPKYCSDDCMHKANWATKEARRRKKIKAATVDRDITVMGLFKRDAGVCYICGKRCNVEDYIMRGETFIAGDWYPSIDHVVPLAKGGAHSWDNVRLAHRRCNILKRDNFVG